MQLQKDLEELQYLIEKYINNKQLDFKEAADGSAICQIGSLEIRPFTEIMYKDIWQYSARKLAAEVTKTLSRRPEKDITECKELFSSWKQYEQSMLAAQALYKLYLMDCAEKAPDIVSKTDYITYLESYAKSGCFESFTYEEYLEDKKIRENLKDFHNFFEFTASELMDDDYMHHLVGENHSILAYKDDFIKANKRVINVIQNNMKLDSEMER